MLTGANDRVQAVLEKAGIVNLVGSENCFRELSDALAVCRQLAEHDSRMAKGKSLSETAKGVLEVSRQYFYGGRK